MQCYSQVLNLQNSDSTSEIPLTDSLSFVSKVSVIKSNKTDFDYDFDVLTKSVVQIPDCDDRQSGAERCTTT